MKKILLICMFIACLVSGGFIVLGAGGDFYVIPVRQAAVPEGTIIMWSGEIDPAGHPIIKGKPDTRWHVCDGTEGTPDLTGRFVWGSMALPGGGWNTGDVGGAASVTLTTDNLPAHTHHIDATTEVGGAHSHRSLYADLQYSSILRVAGPSIYVSGHEFTEVLTSCPDPPYSCEHQHTLRADTQATGGSETLSILPPYYALVFLMYTGA